MERKLNFNAFYVPAQHKVYLCWEKGNGLTDYTVYKGNKELISTNDENNTIKRPQEFDIDHWTELFRPDTRNWLCFKDENTQHFQSYDYYVIGTGEDNNKAESMTITVNVQ